VVVRRSSTSFTKQEHIIRVFHIDFQTQVLAAIFRELSMRSTYKALAQEGCSVES